jgi:hypothetical protein
MKTTYNPRGQDITKTISQRVYYYISYYPSDSLYQKSIYFKNLETAKKTLNKCFEHNTDVIELIKVTLPDDVKDGNGFVLFSKAYYDSRKCLWDYSMGKSI